MCCVSCLLLCFVAVFHGMLLFVCLLLLVSFLRRRALRALVPVLSGFFALESELSFDFRVAANPRHAPVPFSLTESVCSSHGSPKKWRSLVLRLLCLFSVLFFGFCASVACGRKHPVFLGPLAVYTVASTYSRKKRSRSRTTRTTGTRAVFFF